MFQLMFDHNFTLNRYLWDSMMTLSDAQFVKEVTYSHGSLRNHLMHMIGVDGRWLRRLQGHPDPGSFKPEASDVTTREGAKAMWDSVAADMGAYILTLTPEQLSAVPPNQSETAWQILLQLIFHSVDHRSQMLRVLYDFGAPTFDQDLILYLSQRGQ